MNLGVLCVFAGVIFFRLLQFNKQPKFQISLVRTK
jgi:hypothetical protein